MKRKSLLFLLFLALGLPWAANAQETLTVCDGTTTNGKIPVNGLYVDTQGTTSEFIIPATTEGMSNMEGGTVSKLTFYVPNPPATWGSPTIQLYIGEVDYTTLSTLNGPINFTVVATGVWDNTQTTIEVEFDTPYTYEGGNLLIGTYVQTKSSTYNTTNFAGVSAESGSSRYNNGSGSGTAQSFLPKTTFTYTPGGGSFCEKPATMEAFNVTSNSAVLSWTGGSGTYNLEYKLTSAEDWTRLLTNTSATTYTLQDLNSGKAYQARVQSVCGEDVSGWKSVNFRTSFAIPLIEEFGTSIPTGWAMYTGLLENVMAGTAELTSTTYGWNFGEGNGVFDNHAYVNIYGSNCHKWLVLPTVTMEDSIQLQFDMALTAYNSNIPEPILTGIDDKFIVLINVGSNWTILRQWDNAGSEYVYNDIASTTTGQTVSIDLSSYAGQQVAVAFYGESTESNADNNLHIDNVSITRVNATDMYIVTVSANPAIGGMVSGGGEFAYGQTCTLTATPAEGYSFVNWIKDDVEVSTEATYSFTVSEDATYVANFIENQGSGIQISNFAQGWNWVSFYIETEDPMELFQMLVEGLADNGLIIMSRNAITEYDGVEWFGDLDNIVNETMYLIDVSDDVDIELQGTFTHPAEHPITISNDLNWIGYPLSTEMSLEEAFSGFSSAYDVIISQECFAFYHPTAGWCGTLKTLEPGMGLLYKSSYSGDRTFIYPDGPAVMPTEDNITATNNHWVSNLCQYSNNMNIVGVVVLNGVELQSDQYEIGAFVGDECRGSSKPIYVEALDRYIVFLTLTGNVNDEVTFKLYNYATGEEIDESLTNLTFNATVVGLPIDDLYVFDFTSENTEYTVTVATNPVEGGTVEGSGTYAYGETCTLIATANEGYTFVNWTENGEMVSTENPYTFTITGNRNLAANFTYNGGGNAPTGAINGLFSVSEGQQVYFSQGNLQYQALTNTWLFAEHQYDYVGDANSSISQTYSGWIDLFGWGTSGYNHGANCYQPWSTSESPSDYYAYGDWQNNLYDGNGQADWGYNAISNGGNTANQWRTLTQPEWDYVFNTRSTASGIRWAKALVNGVRGIILLPDNWTNSIYELNTPNGGSYGSNSFTAEDWANTFEANGAVFLPAAGSRDRTEAYGSSNGDGYYWSSSYRFSSHARVVSFNMNTFTTNNYLSRHYGFSVRLVRSAGQSTSFIIDATADPAEGGTVTGAGTFEFGSICTLAAAANEGYHFVSWTKNGIIVSVNPMYSFTVMQNATYVANFSNNVHPGLLEGVFSTSENTQIRFSQGNLQYIGSASTPYWKFADNQWDYIGSAQNGTSSNIDRDLFGFAASGYDHGAVGYQPWSTSTSNDSYYAYGSWEYNLYDQTGQADWGYNAIINGGNQENLWRTPTKDEWVYIFNNRTTISGIRYARAIVNNVNGVILLPDNWNASIFTLNNVNMSSSSYSSNDIGATDWMNIFEPAGAVFLPAAGYRNGSSAGGVNENGDYWSSSVYSSSSAYIVNFRPSYLEPDYTAGDGRWYGRAARLVQTCTTSSYTIYVEPNPTEAGTIEGAGTYNYGALCTLTATPNSGYTFVNWTKDNVEVSTEAVYSFTVTEDAAYVANFVLDQGEVTQETSFSQGWNWWNTYVEQAGMDGLSQLEESLGDNGITIRSQVGYTDYYAGYGWYGSLASIDNESSYKIKANAPCSVVLTGVAAVPSQHPITLDQGWTWMGYVSSTAMDVNEALSGLEATVGDKLKSQEGYADYYASYGWYGSLSTIEPSMGLMYYSANSNPVTFTYPDGSKGGTKKRNLTSENNHWEPNPHAYPTNMTVSAVIDLDGEEIQSEDYELAVFDANGECRGSIMTMYVDITSRYYAFLTIYGDIPAELHFGLYDWQTYEECFDVDEMIMYDADAMLGSIFDPVVLHFHGMNSVDELDSHIKVFPNPVNRAEQFSLGLTGDMTDLVRVEIINTLGVVETVHAPSLQTLTAPNVAGVYTLRITEEGKGTVVRKLVVK